MESSPACLHLPDCCRHPLAVSTGHTDIVGFVLDLSDI